MTARGREQDKRDTNYICLNGIDYIEFYVGNAYQASHFYRTAMGLQPIAYSGLETGEKTQLSIVLQENDIRLVLTSALFPEGAIAEHVRQHGDGIKDIAFQVDNAVFAFEEAVKRGARPIEQPKIFNDENGRVIKATIMAINDTVHS